MKLNLGKILIGADPELFLKDQAGKYISAVGKFGGTKQKPKPIPRLGAGFAMQEDNVALEFNVPPVRLDSGLFLRQIYDTLDILAKDAESKGLLIAIDASAEFDDDQLDTPEARNFGCEPDFNVWSLCQNPRPKAKNSRLRSCGGHIHVGYTRDRIGLGRALDLFVGCPSILFDPDRNRRTLYGAAGTIRQKEYGVEYRTLSNFWLKTNLSYVGWLTDNIRRAIQFVEERRQILAKDGKLILDCINNSNQIALRKLTSKYNLRY